MWLVGLWLWHMTPRLAIQDRMPHYARTRSGFRVRGRPCQSRHVPGHGKRAGGYSPSMEYRCTIYQVKYKHIYNVKWLYIHSINNLQVSQIQNSTKCKTRHAILTAIRQKNVTVLYRTARGTEMKRARYILCSFDDWYRSLGSHCRSGQFDRSWKLTRPNGS